jgi:hypothetical protein
MTESLTCPRCSSANLSLTLQTLTVFGTDGSVEVGTIDSDSFIDLSCTDCNLMLSQEPGDGRLRNAYIETDVAMGGTGDETERQYEDAMIALADRMIDWAYARANED